MTCTRLLPNELQKQNSELAKQPRRYTSRSWRTSGPIVRQAFGGNWLKIKISSLRSCGN